MAFDLKDYVEVAERVREWYARHPEGRIVPSIVRDDADVVVVKAAVFRTSDPGEPPAGVGHSQLAKPGTTPYTRGSELENAETSAAGRALVFAGIPSKAVASSEEVKSKRSAKVEPAPKVTRSEGSGMAAVDGAGGDGEAPPASTRSGASADGTPGAEGRERSDPPNLSPEEEQQNAYIQVLRDGPGNTQAVLQARALYESDARRVRNLRDLTLDELVAVINAFKERVSA